MIFNAHHVQVENETSRSLTTFGSDTKVLGKLLMRFSQSEKTLGSQAVLHALLGLASLARYGYNEQAMELKIASLRALGTGLESCHNAFERVYHVAAGMLLCSIEVSYPCLHYAHIIYADVKPSQVHQASCSASEWTWYIRGIKEVLFSETADKNCVIDKSEKDLLVKWVYYHDVMKQFILRHWGKGPQHPDDTLTHPPRLQHNPNHPNFPTIALPRCRPSPQRNPNKASPPPTEIAPDAILEYHTSPLDPTPWTTLTITLMSELCTTIPTNLDLASMSPTEIFHHHSRIQILDYRIRTLRLPPTSPSPYPHPVLLLYKLSMLIYLNRITSNILSQGEKLQSYIDEAFTLLPQLDSCKPHFPMYVVGWEARTEEQRATWLEMLDRTGRSKDARSVFHVGALVRAGWAQDDLGLGWGREGGYWERVSALVGCCSTMPSFV